MFDALVNVKNTEPELQHQLAIPRLALFLLP